MPTFFTNRLRASDYRVIALYWLLAAPIIGYGYVVQFSWGQAVPAILYNIVLDTAAVYVLVFVILRQLARGHLLHGLLAFVGFAVGSGLLYFFGYELILRDFGPFSFRRLIWGIMHHAQSYGVLGVLMMGKSYFDAQHRLLRVQKAQAESELKTLRAQIDPHFLFNNLNILYALIQQDREEASHFLSCFSSLYRYLIRHRDADLVPLAEELRFAEEYIYLLRHRFGQAYDFQTTLHVAEAELHQRLVVPGTLQVLIENAIKHNRGGDDVPLLVTLDVHSDALTVRNRVAPKRTPTDSTGTGLHNLRERYRLLADAELLVQRDAFFTVTVPLLAQQAVPAIPA
ncbi:sensor histidine kinase [Hymenobacter jeollabukensis]|uniref:Signal transduction histidine kinase internal region domain-containing protein n=1 Tax=Hymenobacter jeollabukensis TaxID=2025313 RepID=A0A5R8WSC2_9BACT|nr:sensor histidine kinase [Hymenobacter jeollabukensis]TLM94083.1 hypothetical protein FDY95_08640 [Hymenobacter jeollabukensis]